MAGCGPTDPVRIECGYTPTLEVGGATHQWGLPYSLEAGADGFALSVWPQQTGRQVNLVSIRNASDSVLQLKGIDSSLNLTSFLDNEFVTMVLPFAPRYAEFSKSPEGLLQVQSTADQLCLACSQGSRGNTLRVHVYLVGAAGLQADTIRSDPDFASMLTEWRRLFQLASITILDDLYLDVSPEDVERYRILREPSDLSDVLRLTGDPSGDLDGVGAGPMVLNLVLVDDFMLFDRPEAIGQTGLLPGPPGLHGTRCSGIVAEMTSFRQDPPFLALIVAHESGHFLGLRHTSELFDEPVAYGRTDPIDDTPECRDVLSQAPECPDRNNLMFPLVLPQRTPEDIELSPQQAWVLQHNPLVGPGHSN